MAEGAWYEAAIIEGVREVIMPKIIIVTEDCFRKRLGRDEIQRRYIDANELYDLLNSASDDGTVEEYILRKPEKREGGTCAE